MTDAAANLASAANRAAERFAMDRQQVRAMVAPYQTPQLNRSLGQIADSFLPFLGVVAAMYWSLGWHFPGAYAVTLAMAVVAAGLTVRIFIIQHDCGHGAFLPSATGNTVLGLLCSIVTCAPYDSWRRQHAGHHGHWNNLDRRDTGVDIYSTCLTVEEYGQLGRGGRLMHRMLRHPVISLVILPPLVFLALYRLPFDMPPGWRRERWGVYLTNLALAAAFGGLVWAFGWRAVLLVHLPIMLVASILGVWLFSVQHRFEDTLWAGQQEWSAISASLGGSSYLKLPRILQWFTGNIGFHHIHHLSPLIPNYRLQACHDANPALQNVPTLSLGRGLLAWRYVLWDKAQSRMVRFGRTAAPVAVGD